MIYHANIDARRSLKTDGWLSLVDANCRIGQLFQELHIRTGSPTNCLSSTNMLTLQSDLDFHEEPIKSYDAALLRNTYALSALKEYVGEEVLGKILRDLVQEYRGLNFSHEDFREIAIAHEPRFEDIAQNWLNTNKLPGFVVSGPSIEQLPTDDLDSTIFQTVFKLRNVEPVPGIVKVSWTEEQAFGANQGDFSVGNLPVQQIEPDSSYQFAVKSNLKPTSVTIEVPMSLNRTPIKLSIPSLDEIETSFSSSQPNIKPIQWNPIRSDQVIIDDLDPGFSVSGNPKEPEVPRFVPKCLEEFVKSFREQSEGMDLGLPTYNRSNSILQWTRAQKSGFGRYRNTFTRVRSVSVETAHEDLFSAKFAANLPYTGMWTLEYSVPGRILLELMLRDRHNTKSESPSEHRSESSVEYTTTLVVRINNQLTPIELNPLELQEEVDVSGWDTMISHKNITDRQLVRFFREAERFVNASYWIALGTFNVADPRVEVEILNNSFVSDTFADAVRWTYEESGE